MTRKTFRELETPTGTGEVYGDGKLLFRVKYSLRATQEILHIDGSSTVEGVRSVSGQLSPPEDDPYAFLVREEDNLTLYLEDGRKLDFFIIDSGGAIAPKSGFYT